MDWLTALWQRTESRAFTARMNGNAGAHAHTESALLAGPPREAPRRPRRTLVKPLPTPEIAKTRVTIGDKSFQNLA